MHFTAVYGMLRAKSNRINEIYYKFVFFDYDIGVNKFGEDDIYEGNAG